jgi:hypothetical protein
VPPGARVRHSISAAEPPVAGSIEEKGTPGRRCRCPRGECAGELGSETERDDVRDWWLWSDVAGGGGSCRIARRLASQHLVPWPPLLMANGREVLLSSSALAALEQARAMPSGEAATITITRQFPLYSAGITRSRAELDDSCGPELSFPLIRSAREAWSALSKHLFFEPFPSTLSLTQLVRMEGMVVLP